MNEQEAEDLQKNIMKGVYRGKFMSKNGWDPGDTDATETTTIIVIALFSVLIISHTCSWLFS
tara:strand:+ start:855 stop:1040 length:186 start_codon:yes stop_codon:yes gene_type:complete